MSAELQILELAGQGVDASDIAATMGMELPAVEFVLRRNGLIKDDEISDDDFRAIQDGLLDLAKYSKNEFVKAKVGIFLYERKKGPTASLKGAPAVNIGNLNLLIAASHERLIRALGGTSNTGGAAGASQTTTKTEEDQTAVGSESGRGQALPDQALESED